MGGDSLKDGNFLSYSSQQLRHKDGDKYCEEGFKFLEIGLLGEFKFLEIGLLGFGKHLSLN